MNEEEIGSITEELQAALEAESKSESESETEPLKVVVSPEEGATEETEDKTEVEEDDEASAEPEEVFQAPDHWSSDLKEQFGSLQPEAQEILLARDKEFQTGYQEKAEGITAISEAIEPWKDNLAQRGVTPDQAIRVLFAAQHSIDQNPLQGILQVAQNYGVLDQLKAQFTPKEDDSFMDPEVKALKQELADLRGTINTAQQQDTQQNTSEVAQIIETFKTETDDAGKVVHPHFEKLKTMMAPHVSGGDSMEEAYNKVVWTLPEYRAEQESAKVEKTDEEKAAKVKKAKKAARKVRSSGNADSTEEGDDDLTIKEELDKTFRQLSA